LAPTIAAPHSEEHQMSVFIVSRRTDRFPAGSNPEVYDEGCWSRVGVWAGRLGLTGPAAIMQACEVPGAG
jgi:hypothetical protein